MVLDLLCNIITITDLTKIYVISKEPIFTDIESGQISSKNPFKCHIHVTFAHTNSLLLQKKHIGCSH